MQPARGCEGSWGASVRQLGHTITVHTGGPGMTKPGTDRKFELRATDERTVARRALPMGLLDMARWMWYRGSFSPGVAYAAT